MVNEMRLIDAAPLMKNGWVLEKHGVSNCIIGRMSLADVPIIDPDSLRPKGMWIGEGDGYADGELVYDVWYCSECDYCIDDGTDDPELLPNYCPNCGAKMEV